MSFTTKVCVLGHTRQLGGGRGGGGEGLGDVGRHYGGEDDAREE